MDTVSGTGTGNRAGTCIGTVAGTGTDTRVRTCIGIVAGTGTGSRYMYWYSCRNRYERTGEGTCIGTVAGEVRVLEQLHVWVQ